jgi:hypothetical protein
MHHIINPAKRKVIVEWAISLRVCGFSKIGWPGVVVVEGEESDVKEYVSRLQRLRWKSCVVRGEQLENVPAGDNIDCARKIPLGFTEFGEKGMSDLADACRHAGVEDLFLTSMKIFRKGDNEDTNPDTTNSSSACEPTVNSKVRTKKRWASKEAEKKT